METLKKHLPVSVPEGLNELQKIAVRFEEKIYTAATNQVQLTLPLLFLRAEFKYLIMGGKQGLWVSCRTELSPSDFYVMF
jgi:hypothetical protein